LRRTNIFALLALALVAVLAIVSQADALQAQKAYKEMVVTIIVTPSPAPVGFLRPAAPAAAPLAVTPASSSQFAQLVADPFAGPVQIASSPSAWDVAPGVTIAQSSAQPPAVPVKFVAKPDPNAAFIHIVPHTPTLNAPYGITTFTCVFEVYTFYTNTYKLLDWGYGTSKTAGSGAGTFPIENYTTVSYLSWAVPDFSAVFTPYNNAGPPGETTWTGAANQAQQHCVDLKLNVPNSQAAGTYTATVQYNLYVTLP
jgi:hypothetical protein